MEKKVHSKPIRLPLDTRNRVCLTRFLPKNLEVISYKAYQEGNKIILEPLIEMPAETIASVKRGLEDIKAGRISELERDFSEFLGDDEI
jgi:hypothetical protein